MIQRMCDPTLESLMFGWAQCSLPSYLAQKRKKPMAIHGQLQEATSRRVFCREFHLCVTARSAYPSLESLSRHSKKSDASSCAVSLSLTSSPHIRSKALPIFGSCFDGLTHDECEAFRRLDRMLKWMYSSFCRTSWSQNLEDKLMDPSRSLGHIFSFALVFSKNLTLHRISLSTSLFQNCRWCWFHSARFGRSMEQNDQVPEQPHDKHMDSKLSVGMTEVWSRSQKNKTEACQPWDPQTRMTWIWYDLKRPQSHAFNWT